MDDCKRSRAEARAARARELAIILAELGVTPPEASLLNVVHYGVNAPPDDVPRPDDEPVWAAIGSWAAIDFYSVGGKSTKAECRAALTACLDKGWLQVIDESALVKIAGELREGRILDPIRGFPSVGAVDFTDAGAELWRQIEERGRHGSPAMPSSWTNIVCAKSSRYFPTRAAAVAEIERVRDEDDVVSVSGPHLTGPWRAQWWRRFPEGYRIDIEQRTRSTRDTLGIEGESCYFASTPRGDAPRGEDPQRLRYILDCHNVRFEEWTVLVAMEDGPRNLDRAERFGLRACILGSDVTVSEEDVRSGLDACLRYGWLRALDQQSLDEIHLLLRNDPAFLTVPKTAELRPVGRSFSEDPSNPGQWVPSPVPFERRWGEIDFTSAGAALYRMISAAWLGPDWEDDFVATKRYYWEEHLYCEAEEGFRRDVQQHIADGSAIEAGRVVPLGPWCVRWWDRFPSGYRLELEIGERR